MNDCQDEAVPEASAAPVASPDPNVPEITVRASDAILGPATVNEENPARGIPPLFKRLLTYGPHAILAVSLGGFAWVTGSHFSGGQLSIYPSEPRPGQTVLPPDGIERTEMLRSVQKMADEIRILKADVKGMHATLTGKVEQLERDSAAKLSKVSGEFDHLEQQIAALRTAAPAAAAPAPGAAPVRKKAHGDRHDAFDPSQDPAAPGAPRTLGRFTPSASSNTAGDKLYGQGTD